jgi:hypothetical protein
VQRGGTSALSLVTTPKHYSCPYAYECSSAKSRLFHTGDFPEVDEKGQEKWPKGDEKAWKDAMRGITTGKLVFFSPTLPFIL